MSTLVFTICARNYVGLSLVLEQSVLRHGAEIDFRIYVADGWENDNSRGTILSAPDVVAPFIDATEFVNMAFVYNVTEFCTSLKAACFMRGFADGYDKCIYMDPDMLVLADIDHIARELDDGDILMTPHICIPAASDGPRADAGILATGVYNLGFLALGKSGETDRFLLWWHERLRRQAFNDHYNALYTDQRWMDFVPSLFSTSAVRVWRHLGCNLAPWNYHERRVDLENGAYVVRPRVPDPGGEETTFPLVFLHFSGFDFRAILNGTFDQVNLANAEVHADLLPLYALYGDEVRANRDDMQRYLELPYGFDRFADGSQILPSHRRLLRVWRQRHGDVADPFATGTGSFHEALRRRKLLGTGTSADLAADKASARSVRNADQLMSRARWLFRVLFGALGRSRFFFVIRALNRLSHVEQHYDTFRIDEAAINRAPKILGGDQ